jgi:hypothetical protein
MIESYSDVAVIRHPVTGSAKELADGSDITGHQRWVMAPVNTRHKLCWIFIPFLKKRARSKVDALLSR